VVAAAPVVAAAAAPPPPPPADTDGDGVVDGSDQCPDTPKGERVGSQGCSCDVTRQLQFKVDSAELTDEDKAILDEVAGTLTRLKFVSGTVVGHTDSTGSDAYNQSLSERRAQTVANYLADKGIGGGRLQVKGVGESESIADNATKEGRAQNRRVVLKRTDCDASN
jgi:outer membrane protein OmpA-like peptidoglycan-associated protein